MTTAAAWLRVLQRVHAKPRPSHFLSTCSRAAHMAVLFRVGLQKAAVRGVKWWAGGDRQQGQAGESKTGPRMTAAAGGRPIRPCTRHPAASTRKGSY
jgi:hypothetical protein